MKSKPNIVKAEPLPNYTTDSVKVDAGSVVVDDQWVNYGSTIIKINTYIASVVVSPRTRFFQNRNYAVMLLVGLDPNQGIQIVEGTHVPYTTMGAVPYPTSYAVVPLLGIVLVQDGTSDLIYGYKPLKQESLKFFSGSGNIAEPNWPGATGMPSVAPGDTGVRGPVGYTGVVGLTGWLGVEGSTGLYVTGMQGETGVIGMTGICWDIYIPFETFS